MIDRAALMLVTESIRDHLYIVDRFLHDVREYDKAVELEVLGRCNLIEARLKELRAGVSPDWRDPGVPDFKKRQPREHVSRESRA